MKIKKTKLKGVYLINPKRINDGRGYFKEIYNFKKLNFIKLQKFQENRVF